MSSTVPSPALRPMSPARRRRRLVLPAPFAPTRTVSDDGRNSTSTPLNRGKPFTNETASRKRTEAPSTSFTGLPGQGVDVRGHHHLDQAVEVDFALPTQLFVRLGGVADQQVHL